MGGIISKPKAPPPPPPPKPVEIIKPRDVAAESLAASKRAARGRSAGLLGGITSTDTSPTTLGTEFKL